MARKKERKKKGKISKTASTGFNVLSDSILVLGGVLIALMGKNLATYYIPSSQQSFYPYAIELGTGITVALIMHSAPDLAKPLLAGSLVAMGLTGAASITANTSQSNLFQTRQQYLTV